MHFHHNAQKAALKAAVKCKFFGLFNNPIFTYCQKAEGKILASPELRISSVPSS